MVHQISLSINHGEIIRFTFLTSFPHNIFLLTAYMMDTSCRDLIATKSGTWEAHLPFISQGRESSAEWSQRFIRLLRGKQDAEKCMKTRCRPSILRPSYILI